MKFEARFVMVRNAICDGAKCRDTDSHAYLAGIEPREEPPQTLHQTYVISRPR